MFSRLTSAVVKMRAYVASPTAARSTSVQPLQRRSRVYRACLERLRGNALRPGMCEQTGMASQRARLNKAWQISTCLRLATLAVFCATGWCAQAQDAAVTLIHRPQLAIPPAAAPRPAGTGPLSIDAFPRLAGDSPAIARINAALDRANARAVKAASECIAMDPEHSDWSRSIDVTMAGPRFVSFVAHDDSFCGGPHPNNWSVVLAYDLTTGSPVDWTRLLPARFRDKPGTTTGGDGTVLGTLSSPALKALYIRDLKPDAECRDTLNETDFNFTFRPDAQADGLVMDQDDLPHVVLACGGSVTLSTKMLRTMGADPSLLEAIETAHVLYAASAAGTYTKRNKGNATLTMTDRGGEWEATIEAGGIPRGAATAADCNFIAVGQVTGDRFAGQVMRTFGGGDTTPVAPGHTIAITVARGTATLAEAKVGDLCALGVDVMGHYAKKDDR